MSNERRVGVWLIGACGSVSTCAIAGVEALRAGLIDRTGMVTDLEDFRSLDLAAPENFVFGGHEARPADLVKEAEEFGRANGVLTPEILAAARPGLERASANLRPGLTLNCGDGLRRVAPVADRDRLPLPEIVESLKRDLAEFRSRHALDDLVVVNLASAEREFAAPREFAYLESFLGLLAADRRELFPASVLYATAALESGCPYVNFTSSPGSSLPAVDELSRRHGAPHVGRDAKTGETLLKTALAPMFAARNLRVLSWEGHNLLGNRDGLVLDSPAHKEAKLRDKDAVLRDLLPGGCVHSRVRIDYVPSLGDWKTAWDFIHFSGFLGARMHLQFTWHGCDSALAAPLVLDLVRFAEFAHRRGERGTMRHLACFFKAPYAVEEHNFHLQTEMLLDYAQEHRTRSRHPAAAEAGRP
ncbi:MAG: inositol-3-phosphate synthase [Planctomycetes bacterium]|nr:inositol-3-phosphate synthase [Planctomycetota bacterium]